MLLFLAYILIGILYWRIQVLGDRLDLVARTRPVRFPEPPPSEPTPRPAPVPTPAATPEPPAAPRPTPIPVSTPIIARPALAPAPSASEKLEHFATAADGWEELVGGNILNKLGALVLVIGLALFLSYSFANMGPAGRAFTGLSLSIAILGGGVFAETQERYRTFARGVMAAGWAGIYFTTYAMHALPATQIIDSPVIGTMLLVAIAVAMVAHSLRYRVESLTGLAFGCIFAALALSSLNTFVAISLIPLAASMLYLARRFQWHTLALFAAAATYAVFLTRPASDSSLASIQTMLFIFWAMFEGFDLLRLHSTDTNADPDRALFGLNALAGLSASAVLWSRMAPDSMWMFSAGASVLYLASTWLRFAVGPNSNYEFTLILSSSLAALAIFARVPGLWRSLGLMLEAEALFLAAHFLRVRVAKLLSAFGFAGALAFIWGHFGTTNILGLFDVHDTTPSFVALASLFYLNRWLSKDPSYWSYFASIGITIVAASETTRVESLSTVLLVWSLLLFEFGYRKGLVEFRIQAYAVALLSTFAGLLDAWTWSCAVAASIAYAQAVRASRWLKDLPEKEQLVLRYGSAAGTTLFTTLLIHRLAPSSYEAILLLAASALFIELADSGWPKELRNPAVAMNVVALFRLLGIHMSEVQKQPAPHTIVAFAGAALIYFWFTARLLRSTRPEATILRSGTCAVASMLALTLSWMLTPAPFVPVTFAVLAMLLWEGGLAAGAIDVVWIGRAVSVISAAALLFDVPADPSTRVAIRITIAAAQLRLRFRIRDQELSAAHGILAALLTTATLFDEVSGGMLTLSWSLEGAALLTLGFVARDRWLRLPGLALLLTCIAKVFVYDLRNLETFYRILSFIGLGVILLAVSWIYTRFQEQLRKLL